MSTESKLAEAALLRVREQITIEKKDFGYGFCNPGDDSPGRAYSIKENLLCAVDREIEKLAAHDARKGGGVSDDLARKIIGKLPLGAAAYINTNDMRAALEAAGCGVDVDYIKDIISRMDRDPVMYPFAVELTRALGGSHE